jgi:MarR family transcriptional repressor of emrRAB
MALRASDRVVNLFGALALRVSDRMRSALDEAVSLVGETAAAAIVIGHAPAISIDQISRILRLSHAGAVRLVDRLVDRWLAERRPSVVDRRIMSLGLTKDGRSNETVC